MPCLVTGVLTRLHFAKCASALKFVYKLLSYRAKSRKATTAMITHTDHFHGSDLEKIEQLYHIKKENIISFSANVNPLGLSGKLCEALKEHLDVITSYPDREYTELRKSIASYCHTDFENVVAGNGSTELISAVLRQKAFKNACLISPTYSEYEREISLGGGVCHYYMLTPENHFALCTEELFAFLSDKEIELLVLCNPNNPTSTALNREILAEILGFCKKNGVFVMFDETYIEFVEDDADTTAVPFLSHFDNFIILRGISKFFASPGLRLGYGLTGSRTLIRSINETKNPWTINSLAEYAGRVLFTDEEYIRRTKTLIHTERNRVCGILRTIPGLKVYEPAANFVLVKIEKENRNADILFDAAIRCSLMIRNCSTFQGLDNRFFRLCFMNPEENDLLLSCIRKTMG